MTSQSCKIYNDEIEENDKMLYLFVVLKWLKLYELRSIWLSVKTITV